MATSRLCSIPDCGKAVHTAGMCFKHFRASPHYKHHPCSVTGCEKPEHRKGLCSAHSKRLMRTGSIEGKNVFFGTHIQWIRDHLDHNGDECLIWPFQLTDRGRGRIWFRGRPYTADTVVCILKFGERPSRRHEAAHSCGKGHEGCVNPKHLRWATLEENKADMVMHGTAPRGENNKNHILTEEDVRQIRSLRGKMFQYEIASQFGVSQSTVGRVQLRQTWAWLD